MNQYANDFIVIRLRRYSIPLLFGYAVIPFYCYSATPLFTRSARVIRASCVICASHVTQLQLNVCDKRVQR
jgi:hypothetical protein